MAGKELVKAVAYIRTSSATNVGADKDSDRRQREAIALYAKRAGYGIIEEFTDEAVKGDNAVMSRPGFSALMEKISSNGVRTIIVENASRFARDIIVQETGYRMLRSEEIVLIAADSPENFIEETPTSKLVRQILGVISEFEKDTIVLKLRGARERKMREQAKRGEKVKCGGRLSYAERDPAMVTLAKKLHRYPVNGRRRTLQDVAAELAENGHVASSGKPFGAGAIARMLEQG